MTCEEFNAAMPTAYKHTHRAVAKLPLWWAWTPQLGTEIEQRLFIDSGFTNPLPTFYELFILDGKEIFVLQIIGPAVSGPWSEVDYRMRSERP